MEKCSEVVEVTADQPGWRAYFALMGDEDRGQFLSERIAVIARIAHWDGPSYDENLREAIEIGRRIDYYVESLWYDEGVLTDIDSCSGFLGIHHDDDINSELKEALARQAESSFDHEQARMRSLKAERRSKSDGRTV